MPLYFGLLLFSFLVVSIAIVPFIDFLYRSRLIHRTDTSGLTRENTTASHMLYRLHAWKAGTPVGGGLLIILLVSALYAVILPLMARFGVRITSIFSVKEELNVIFFTFISFALIGLLDDLSKIFPNRSIPALRRRTKFALLFCLSLLVSTILYANLGLSTFSFPFMPIIDLGRFYIPAAALVIFLLSAGLDFTDGLDGLAGGILLVALFVFWTISASSLDTLISFFISLWIGALLAFLYFNTYPARIWLGNSGALSFGATLAVIGLILGKTSALLVIGLPFTAEIAGFFLQEISLAVFRHRLFPIAPFHHWLQVVGWPEPKIVLRAWLLAIMLSVFGLWLSLL